MYIEVKANAKINLFLDILGKRQDGYHYVDMVMQSIDLHDTLKIETIKQRHIIVESDYEFDVQKENNTVYKASKNFFEFCNIKDVGIKITLNKTIPVYAGLAGGSADAAAVLVGLNKIFDTKLSVGEIMDLGKKIGADVPFCTVGGTMTATGIGTDLKCIGDLPECHIVIVKPPINVSTKDAYEKSDSMPQFKQGSINKMICAISKSDLNEVCERLYNRFEEVTFIDEVVKIKSSMRQSGALGASMSGSGPSVFGIFESRDKAHRCAKNLKRDYHQTFLCRPCSSGCEF